MPAEFQHADAGTDDAGTDVRDLGSCSVIPWRNTFPWPPNSQLLMPIRKAVDDLTPAQP